ncbi:fungal-specific transcription factor domain-containing protein [Filobasidium floriforme]|uniref:fungal-specific transcription factor domain-containing protein n=1 Tax=Filobasidium floriforme TaxID=5210 RepID=UPI001E8E425D|nr:fungal-specific transcription factor domain-containing protein [Filobasidium floriforme]KAH8077061.1 fungal-specific transcription factor domain-containing protein [Filobasidium floriforme]
MGPVLDLGDATGADTAELESAGRVAVATKAPERIYRDSGCPKSLDLINHFVSLYFDKFEAQMPIIHLPTFRIDEADPLLVASMISLGATFSRLPGSKTFSTELVEVVRRCINVLFELDSANLRSVDLVHVSMLSCISGLLSGTKRSYEMAEAARGVLVTLCRRADLLNSSSSLRQLALTDNGGTDPSGRWLRWARAESRKRLGTCICLLDSMFPAMHDTPAYISQGQMTGVVLPCDEVYWQATSARMWTDSLGIAGIPPSPLFASAISAILTPIRIPRELRPAPIRSLSPFGGLVLISALQHHIFEYGAQSDVYHSIGVHVPVLSEVEGSHGGFEGRRKWLRQSLESWRTHYHNGDEADPMVRAGQVLYHVGHIALAVNIRVLFTAAGKMGWETARRSLPDLEAWAGTGQAEVATKHALDLLDVLAAPGSVDLFYLPGSAFIAVLALWAARKKGSIPSPASLERMIRLGMHVH